MIGETGGGEAVFMIESGKFLQQRYRIDKQIGQGGMGAVYVATDERFGSVVAIKETLCMDSNFRKAIEREARLLNSLKHAALPRVSDHFEEDNSQFLVMEYVPGEDLYFILEETGKPFPVEEVLKWADQLLEALDFLHNQVIPVIHRDIKPQNLKLTTQGQVILLDFGLAKGNPTDAGHHTAAKSIFGYSRNYASLEQIQGTGTDPRSDLYSLAATLYHLMTGVAPEDALTRAMSVLSQKPDPLVPASTINPDVPRGVAGVLQKALDLNASERPNSAAEMRQMFRESASYAYLADAVTVTGSMQDAQVFAQKTKLMPEETLAGGPVQTDVKTEVMPAYLSELTAVQAGASTGGGNRETSGVRQLRSAVSAKKRRPAAIAAGLVGLLLFGGAVAGGLYTLERYSSQSLVAEPDAQPVQSAQTQTNAEAPVSNTSGIEGASTREATVTDAGPANNDRAKTKTTAEKPSETAADPKPPASTIIEDDGETVEIKPPAKNGAAGDIIITKKNPDGTTTTQTIKGVRVPAIGNRPPPDRMNPFPGGIDMSKLTPAQRRKLRETIRRNGGVPPYPIPPRP